MKKYLPLVLVEVYLIITLLIYNFGPVQFEGHNTYLFAALVLLYHLAFVLGYYISTKLYRFDGNKIYRHFSPRFFYISLFFALLGVLNTYKNLMLSPTFIPYNLIEDFTRGISEPGLVYTERMSNISDGAVSSSRLLNIISIFFAFFKLFFIFFFLYFWSELSLFKKLLVIVYSFLFISSGIASGTNSVVFIFFIFIAFSLLTILYLRKYKYFSRMMFSFVAIFFIPIGSFGYVMSQRGGGFSYFAGTSPLGDISVSVITPALDSFIGLYYYAFVWLNYYLVQGYYGFSLILNMDLNWTFGFGNSAFLQRQLLVLTGVDVSDLTFQSRVSEYWDESAQWHSFYGQFANDFGFIGLSFFMFFLGYFLSRVWSSIIYNNSFYGVSLIPLFILMFIFFPANNQVFGYIDTLSYFIFISIFWLFEGKNIRFGR